MSTPTQSVLILDHLLEGGSLDKEQARKLYKCSNLAAQIYLLRQAGAKIKTLMIPSTGGRDTSYQLV